MKRFLHRFYFRVTKQRYAHEADVTLTFSTTYWFDGSNQ